MEATSEYRKPQSIIDTHREVLALALRQSLVVTVERTGHEPVRAIVRDLRDSDDFVRLCPDRGDGVYRTPFSVNLARIDRLTLHA